MLTPVKSIRAKCLDCCENANEVKLCPCDGKISTFCALWPYRMGRRPEGSKKRVLTDEQKQIMAERFKKAREAKNTSLEAV